MASPLDEMDFSSLFGPAPAAAPEPDPFGRIGAGDPAWEDARSAWMGGATLRDLFGEQLFDLNGTVGTGQANQRGDVFKLQALLHREGLLDAQATGGPTGYWGNRDDAALRGLQKDNGLTVDGWAGPRGETIGHLRDLYQPPQGLQVSDAEMKSRQTSLQVARDLAGQLGLDPDAIDLSNPAVLPALGAVNFIRYTTGRAREQELQKLQELRDSDPKLAGRLQALAAEIASQPQWHYDKMTPEELQQARRALEEGNDDLTVGRKLVKPLLTKMMRRVSRRYVGPVQKIIEWDEKRRIDDELERRRDPYER